MNITIDPIDHKAGRRTCRLAALLLGTAALCGMSNAAMAETLIDAVTAAYNSNPTLVAQRYRQKSSNENYVQVRSQYGPNLSLSAAARYAYTKDGTFIASEKTGSAFLNLRQQVYSGGRGRGQLEEARSNVRASEEQLRRVEGETIQDVIVVYAAVLRDQKRLEVSRENVEVLREQLDARRARRKVRDVTITDVAQADARLASGEAQLANAEAQLGISRGEYLRVVGHEPGELAPLPELPGMPGSIEEAFDVADAENANLAASRRLEEASRANIAAERGNQRPNAILQAQAGKNGSIDPIRPRDFRNEVLAVVTITQPLWQGGAIRSRIRQAQAQNNTQQALVDGERRQALQDVVQAWNQLGSSRVAVVSGTRQVQAAQIAFAGMEREESYGLRSTIEVLNSEQELASAQLQLLSSRFQEYVSRSSLLLAMGRLDARTINSAIPAKDPSAEFKKVRWRGMLPTDPAMMLLDHVGSAKLYPTRKPDLRGNNQPKPTGQPTLPAQPAKRFTDAPLVPIKQSPLITADQLPETVQHYETAPKRAEPQE